MRSGRRGWLWLAFTLVVATGGCMTRDGGTHVQDPCATSPQQPVGLPFAPPFDRDLDATARALAPFLRDDPGPRTLTLNDTTGALALAQWEFGNGTLTYEAGVVGDPWSDGQWPDPSWTYTTNRPWLPPELEEPASDATGPDPAAVRVADRLSKLTALAPWDFVSSVHGEPGEGRVVVRTQQSVGDWPPMPAFMLDQRSNWAGNVSKLELRPPLRAGPATADAETIRDAAIRWFAAWATCRATGAPSSGAARPGLNLTVLDQWPRRTTGGGMMEAVVGGVPGCPPLAVLVDAQASSVRLLGSGVPPGCPSS